MEEGAGTCTLLVIMSHSGCAVVGALSQHNPRYVADFVSHIGHLFMPEVLTSDL